MHQDLNMGGNNIVNLKALPSNSQDATSKHYTDTYFYKRDGSLPLTGDLNISGHRIKNLRTPRENSEVATKKYVDYNKVDGNDFLKLDGSSKMTGNLDMNNKQINNLPLPTGNNKPTTLVFTDCAYLLLDGTAPMGGNLNMNHKKIMNLLPPVSDTDAATKKYVDEAAVDVSGFLKRAGTVSMTGVLNMDEHRITNLYTNQTSEKDATNKEYVDNLMHHYQVQPSHIKDQFAFLMTNAKQWTDELGNVFFIDKIGDLAPTQGNIHTYNHCVIYTTIKTKFSRWLQVQNGNQCLPSNKRCR